MYGVCRHMSKLGGGDPPAEVRRECGRPNIHTNTFLELHFYPAEGMPVSRWSTLSAPQFSVIPNKRSLRALRFALQ